MVCHAWQLTATLVQAGSALIPNSTAGHSEPPGSHNSCLFSRLRRYSHQPIVLVPFPPPSTLSAPAWVLSITSLGLWVLLHQTLLSCLHSPSSSANLSGIHTLGHISTFQLMLQPLSSYLKWDSPFLSVTFRIKGIFKARNNSGGLREKKSSAVPRDITLPVTGRGSDTSSLSLVLFICHTFGPSPQI